MTITSKSFRAIAPSRNLTAALCFAFSAFALTLPAQKAPPIARPAPATAQQGLHTAKAPAGSLPKRTATRRADLIVTPGPADSLLIETTLSYPSRIRVVMQVSRGDAVAFGADMRAALELAECTYSTGAVSHGRAVVGTIKQLALFCDEGSVDSGPGPLSFSANFSTSNDSFEDGSYGSLFSAGNRARALAFTRAISNAATSLPGAKKTPSP